MAIVKLPRNKTILEKIPLPPVEIEKKKFDFNVTASIKECLMKINPNLLVTGRTSKNSKTYDTFKLKNFINCILMIDNLSKYLDKNDTLIADLKGAKKKDEMVFILKNLYNKYIRK